MLKIKIPPEKSEMRQFFRLIEMLKVDKLEYYVLLTPKEYEELGGTDENTKCSNN